MNRAAELSKAFLDSHPASAARALDQVPSPDAAAFVTSLTEDEGKVAQVIARMQPSRAAALLEQLAPEKAAALLHHAPAYARSILMRALPSVAQQAILKAAPRRRAAALSRYLSYDPGTVGAWMGAPSATFAPDTRVVDCLRELRRLGHRLGANLCVVDDDRRLLGVVDLNDLLAAADETTVVDLMQSDPVTVAPQATLASVVSLEAWDSTLALPVTDRRRLVGSLRFESLREGLAIDRGAPGELQLNVMLMHLGQALLVSLSGLLQVATTAPSLSRLSNDADQR